MITLGIDCGTQSTKAIALDGETGAILASASKSYGLLPGLPPGHLEQDPQEWIAALNETIEKVLNDLGDRRREVSGIGISGQQHGFVPLDAQGKVLRPAKLWCDTSTISQCDEIRNHFGGRDSLIELIGNDMLVCPAWAWTNHLKGDDRKK
jgi:xylulokinase